MDLERSGAIRSPEEMVRLGRAIGSRLSGDSVVGLTGPLGAGKTILARGIAEGLGLDETYLVSSPTYTIMQNYPCGDLEMCHLDLYRIAGSDDLDSTGYRDAVGEGCVLVVEWPEKEPSVLPDQHLLVDTRYADQGRQVTLRAVGDRYVPLVEAVASLAGLT